MPRGFKRSGGPVGMGEPSKEYSPEQVAELMENIRALSARVEELEGKPAPTFDPPPMPIVPVLEAGQGIRLDKSARRVQVSAERELPTGEGEADYHPWQLYVTDGALEVAMEDGVYAYSDDTSFVPKQTTLSYTPANVTDDDTTIFYVKVTVAATAYGDGYLWTIDSISVESVIDETGIPADTADLSDPDSGAGDLHYKIGEVVASGGVATVTTPQDLTSTLALVFPPVLPEGKALPAGSAGDILYYHSSTGWTALAAGTQGDVLVMGATYPEWETPGTGCES